MLKLDEKAAFTVLLLLGTTGLLYVSASLSGPARLVPLAVLVPTLLLLGLQTALDLTPDLAEAWSRLFRKNAFGLGAATATGDGLGRGEARPRQRELSAFGWLAGLLSLLMLVGLAPALPLFTLAYLKHQARERWPLALGMAGAVWVVVHGIFVQLLGARLYEGLLWRLL